MNNYILRYVFNLKNNYIIKNADKMTKCMNNTNSTSNLRNDKVQPLSQNKSIDFPE